MGKTPATPTKVKLEVYQWGFLRIIEVGLHYSLPIHQDQWNWICESIRTGEMRYIELETKQPLRTHPTREGVWLQDDYGSSGIKVFLSEIDFDKLNPDATFKQLIGGE